MSRADVEAFVERRQRAWDAHDAHALSLDHTPDGVVESPLAAGEARGREAIERLYDTFFRAFTDMTLTPLDLVIDGDHVALFATASGTDLGGFMGMAPTSRSVRIAVAFNYHLRDGLIARERRVYDFTGLLVQVGLLKAKPS